MQKALKYKKRKNANWAGYRIGNIEPAYPFYKGSIYHDSEHKEASAWILTGSLSRSKKRNIIDIVDLPPDASREGYIKKLKKLQEKGIIKYFTESCVKNNFKFSIKVSPEINKKTDEELLDLLGLVDKVVENFTFLNPEGDSENTVIKFETSGDYLKTFIDERQKFYEMRKQYQILHLTKEIDVLKERIRFITDVNDNKIIITKRKKSDLEKELVALEYAKVDNNYDHLLGMKMYALTEENIQKFTKLIKEKEKSLNDLINTPIEDIHIKELDGLKKIISPELSNKGIL
jgi:DNA topoisomerase-2